jgi:hypothetical protein
MSGTGIFMFHVGAAEVTVYFWEHTKEDYWFLVELHYECIRINIIFVAYPDQYRMEHLHILTEFIREWLFLFLLRISFRRLLYLLARSNIRILSKIFTHKIQNLIYQTDHSA